MHHASTVQLHRSEPAVTRAQPQELAMRHLRHQTKNALQRIIAQVAQTDLRATADGNALADDIERRIFLSARISDALFGMTESPPPISQRLTALSEATVALLADRDQAIAVTAAAAGRCPPAYEATVLQVAHEMVVNAVKHGMHMRITGQIAVRLFADARGRTALLVRDDGWGPCAAAAGEGMPLMQALAASLDGRVSLSRNDGWTIARLDLPGGPVS